MHFKPQSRKFILHNIHDCVDMRLAFQTTMSRCLTQWFTGQALMERYTVITHAGWRKSTHFFLKVNYSFFSQIMNQNHFSSIFLTKGTVALL
jgi:hypothetical protein